MMFISEEAKEKAETISGRSNLKNIGECLIEGLQTIIEEDRLYIDFLKFYGISLS